VHSINNFLDHLQVPNPELGHTLTPPQETLSANRVVNGASVVAVVKKRSLNKLQTSNGVTLL